MRGRTNAAVTVHGRTDHRDIARERGWGKTPDLCRKHWISTATYYNCKAKVRGLDVSEANRGPFEHHRFVAWPQCKRADNERMAIKVVRRIALEVTETSSPYS